MGVPPLFHRLRSQLRSIPLPVAYVMQAIGLSIVTWLILLALYYQPRFYSSANPGAGEKDKVARLCAIPGETARDWRYIVIHHSATTGGGAAAFERYHINTRHWSSLGYHFVIGNGTQTGDGEIEVGPRWEKQQPGSHASGYNNHGIGICLVGDFETQKPSRDQLHSLRQLVLHLAQKYHVPATRVIGHNECDGAHTACPGKALNMGRLRAWLQNQINSPPTEQAEH